MASQPTEPKVPDAYSDLGLTTTASRSEIKAAYHRLALLHHPDKKTSKDTDATDFRRANEAYELLKDEQAKTHYDKAYARVHAAWVTYRKDLAEFEKNPAAWRKEKADAAQEQARAAAATRRQAQSQYMHGDSKDSDEYGWWPFGASSGRGGSRSDWQSEFEEWWVMYKEEQRKYDERRRHEHLEELARERKAEEAGKRAIERQKKEAELQHANTDGIRVISPEEKLALAKVWVQGIQRKYAEELGLQRLNVAFYSKKVIDLGWEKKKGRHTCHFCDAHVHEYSYCCPSGGAIACRGCKNGITFSSLDHPFIYVNTHAGANKGKGKKGKGKRKTKKNKTKKTQESESEKSEDEPESGDDAEGQATGGSGGEDAAQRQENTQIERDEYEVRQKAVRETQEKALQEKIDKSVRDKADVERAAQEKATLEAEVREAAERRKADRAKELQQEMAQKKAARRKAAKEKAALARAQMRSVEEEKAHKQTTGEQKQQERRLHEKDMRDQAQKKEGRERDARQACENEMRFAKATAKREAEYPDEHEAMEKTVRAKQQAQKIGVDTKIQQEREKTPAATTNGQDPSLLSNTTAATKNLKKKKSPSYPPVCFIYDEEDYTARKCPNKSLEATAGMNGITHSSAISPTCQESNQATLKESPSSNCIKVKLPPHAKESNPSKSKHSQKVASNSNRAAQTLPQVSVTSCHGIEEPSTRALSQELVASGSERVKVKLPQQPEKNDQSSNVVSIEGLMAPTAPIENASKLPRRKVHQALRRPPVCYGCKEKGHIARNCPNKVKKG